jgi:hypothetical protein
LSFELWALIRDHAKIKAQSTKFKKANPEKSLKRGGLFYTQKGVFDSPDTLDYASFVSTVANLSQEGFLNCNAP